MTPIETIRLARHMAAEELATAERLDAVCPITADCHLSAGRALHAISACSAGVDAATARRWAADDRAIAVKFNCRIAAHTADVLDLLASRIGTP